MEIERARADAARGVSSRSPGRYGAVASSQSVAVLERFWRTLKSEYRDVLWPWLSTRLLRGHARSYLRWYNGERPHQGLGGATPNDVFYGRPRPPRRAAGVISVRHIDGDPRLPVYRLRRAA